MNAARKVKAIVQVDETTQIEDELAFLKEKTHRQYLRHLLSMGPDLAHRFLHHDDFMRDPLKFLNARDLPPAELYEKLEQLNKEPVTT